MSQIKQLQNAKNRVETELEISGEIVTANHSNPRWSTKQLLVIAANDEAVNNIRSVLSDMYPNVANTIVRDHGDDIELAFSVDLTV